MSNLYKYISFTVLVLIFWCIGIQNTFSFNGDDLISKIYNIGLNDSVNYIIPDGYDYYLINSTVVSSGSLASSFEAFDDGELKFGGTFITGRITNEGPRIYKNNIEIVNTGNNDLLISYNGFIFKEGTEVNLNGDTKTPEYYQNLVLQFLANPNSKGIMAIITIWIIYFWLFILTVKWGFKTGILSYKNKFIGKK